MLFQVGQKLIQNIFFFGMSNSLINPLIYGAFHLWRPSSSSAPTANPSTCATFQGRKGATVRRHLGDQESSLSRMSHHFRSVRLSISRIQTSNTTLSTRKGNSNPVGNSPTSTVMQESTQSNSTRTNGRLAINKVVRSNTTQNGSFDTSVNKCDLFLNGSDKACLSSSSSSSLIQTFNPGITRCATFDCTYRDVDRMKASIKRRQWRSRIYNDANDHIDYTQEILGDIEAIKKSKDTDNRDEILRSSEV